MSAVIKTRKPKSEKEQLKTALTFDPEKHLYELASGARLMIAIPTLEDENDLIGFGEFDLGLVLERNGVSFKAICDRLLFSKRTF